MAPSSRRTRNYRTFRSCVNPPDGFFSSFVRAGPTGTHGSGAQVRAPGLRQGRGHGCGRGGGQARFGPWWERIGHRTTFAAPIATDGRPLPRRGSHSEVGAEVRSRSPHPVRSPGSALCPHSPTPISPDARTVPARFLATSDRHVKSNGYRLSSAPPGSRPPRPRGVTGHGKSGPERGFAILVRFALPNPISRADLDFEASPRPRFPHPRRVRPWLRHRHELILPRHSNIRFRSASAAALIRLVKKVAETALRGSGNRSYAPVPASLSFNPGRGPLNPGRGQGTSRLGRARRARSRRPGVRHRDLGARGLRAGLIEADHKGRGHARPPVRASEAPGRRAARGDGGRSWSGIRARHHSR